MEISTKPHLCKQIQRIAAGRTIGAQPYGYPLIQHGTYRCNAFGRLGVGADAVGCTAACAAHKTDILL